MDVYSVPLKGGDDENKETMSARARHLVGESEHPQDDAFSRYSSDFVRMKSILLNVDEDDGSEHDDDLDALASINRALSSAGLSNVVNLNRDKRRRGNNSASIRQGPERKTRLTWELHLDLLLRDLIEEFKALENGVQRIVDDDDETETSASEQETQQKEE